MEEIFPYKQKTVASQTRQFQIELLLRERKGAPDIKSWLALSARPGCSPLNMNSFTGHHIKQGHPVTMMDQDKTRVLCNHI